jgi:hypothetical protein
MSVQRAERELAALKDEIRELEARIGKAKDRAIKLEHYVEMAVEFGGRGDEVPTPQRRPNDGTRQRAPQGGMSGRAVQECMAILRERGGPVHTGELSRLITERGIRLGGQNPANALSGYLSRSPELVASRSMGWSLKEWVTNPPNAGLIYEVDPTEAPQSAMAA